VADFGTGVWQDGPQPKCPAELIQTQMENHRAPIHIHLGDIYYAGTKGEAEDGFLKTWSPGQIASYNMNGNHDLYSGDNGYFMKVLQSKYFGEQKNNSYFSFKVKSWLFLALDSSYYSDAFLCTEGRLTDQNQINFIEKQVKDHDGKLAILTHHGPISSDGSEELKLWKDVTKHLKTLPDVWYYGHIHNCMFFNKTVLGDIKTKFRCIGNGSLPYGLGYKIEDAKQKGFIEWYPEKPLENPGPRQSQRLMNGFLNINIKDKEIVETFYYQDGSVGHQHILKTE
jgi:predicted phosphohydrolase